MHFRFLIEILGEYSIMPLLGGFLPITTFFILRISTRKYFREEYYYTIDMISGAFIIFVTVILFKMNYEAAGKAIKETLGSLSSLISQGEEKNEEKSTPPKNPPIPGRSPPPDLSPPVSATDRQPKPEVIPPPTIPEPQSSKRQYGPILEDIVGIRPGIPCQDALRLIEGAYPNVKRPLGTGKIRYSFDVGGEQIEVLADATEVRSVDTTMALTCMPIGGKSVVVFSGRTLQFEKDGRNLADIERLLTEKYGALPQRMNIAAVNPFNMFRMGRVYGPEGVLSSGTTACGDFQATAGYTTLGRFGGANLYPLRLAACIGGLFIRGSRNTGGRVTSIDIEVWDFRIAARAAEDAARQKADEIGVKSKSRLPL